MGYRFEWSQWKAVRNLRKHGVSVTEATTVFGDPLSLLLHDPDHSVDEDRFLLLGRSQRHNLLVVVFTERRDITRIISARRASPGERVHYEEA